MIVAGDRHNHPFVDAGTVLAVGEDDDGPAIHGIRDNEVAERVIRSPVPKDLAVLVALYPPTESPLQCTVEPNLWAQHLLPAGRGESHPTLRRSHYLGEEPGVVAHGRQQR